MNRPIRVLTVANQLGTGGTVNRIYGMLSGSDSRRVQHYVATLQQPQKEFEEHFGDLRHLFDDLGIPVRDLGLLHPAPGTVMPLPRRMLYSMRALAYSARRLSELIREEAIDVVDAHMAPSTVVAAVAGRRTGTPVIATEYHVGPPAPVLLWPIVGRFAFDRARFVVTDSHERAEMLRTWIHRRRNKVRIIPNGIPPPSSSLSRTQARERFGVRSGETAILQLSALQAHKGHKVLLHAARRVIDRVGNVRFLIVGFVRGTGESYKGELHELARELGISDNVFIGPYPGPAADVWRAADLHVHASLFDSLPNAIIEGMSLGVPATVTAVGGVPTHIEDGKNGRLVAPGDPEALADALIYMLEHPAEAARMGACARATYEERFRPEVVWRQLENLFNECIA